MLRIFILRDHMRWSGGTLYLADLLRRLNSEGVHCELFVLDVERNSISEVASEIVASHLIRLQNDPFGVLRFIAELRRGAPQLLLLSGPRSMLIGRIAARLYPTPVVALFNNALPDRSYRRFVQKQFGKKLSGGIAVSRATADWAAVTYSTPRDRISVFYNAKDLRPFYDQDEAEQANARMLIREKFQISESSPLAILAGRVEDAHKGQLGMIRHMPDLTAKLPNAQLLIVGDGPDLKSCIELVSSMALGNTVKFAGRRHDMPRIFAAADAVVLPSQVPDAFPLTALEAAASGRPIVAFATGGLPEAVFHGETGYLASPNSWDEFIDCLHRCLSNQGEAVRLGNAGRTFAKRFTPWEHARDVKNYFRAVVLANKRGRVAKRENL